MFKKLFKCKQKKKEYSKLTKMTDEELDEVYCQSRLDMLKNISNENSIR